MGYVSFLEGKYTRKYLHHFVVEVGNSFVGHLGFHLPNTISFCLRQPQNHGVLCSFVAEAPLGDQRKNMKGMALIVYVFLYAN